jgi:hypothetical protein
MKSARHRWLSVTNLGNQEEGGPKTRPTDPIAVSFAAGNASRIIDVCRMGKSPTESFWTFSTFPWPWTFSQSQDFNETFCLNPACHSEQQGSPVSQK